VKPKDQGVVEADDQKENRKIYDGSLEFKIDEATEEHNGGVVEEMSTTHGEKNLTTDIKTIKRS